MLINVMESWARVGPLTCLILLFEFVDKVQALILNTLTNNYQLH